MDDMPTQPDSDDEQDPGQFSEVYRATDFQRGGGRNGGGFIWFTCAKGSRDRILQLANLRDMEPGAISDQEAWLHFSGMDVVLVGSHMRKVAHRIFLGRCNIVREIRDGQQPEKPDDPIIRAIAFHVPAPPDKPGKPKHEPETQAREKAHRDTP